MSYISGIRLQTVEDAQENASWYGGDASARRIYAKVRKATWSCLETPAESTRRSYQRRLDHELNAVMVLAPTNSHGKRLRKRYGNARSHLFTFPAHPEVPPDNNGSERELWPTATYRKVIGGFRSKWGADRK
jgi:Transposase IS66 family